MGPEDEGDSITPLVRTLDQRDKGRTQFLYIKSVLSILLFQLPLLNYGRP